MYLVKRGEGGGGEGGGGGGGRATGWGGDSDWTETIHEGSIKITHSL